MAIQSYTIINIVLLLLSIQGFAFEKTENTWFINQEDGSLPRFFGPKNLTYNQTKNGLSSILSIEASVNAILPHPIDSNIVYVGTTNNGIWKTSNAKSESTFWKQLNNEYPLPIVELIFDESDPKYNTIIATTGAIDDDTSAVGLMVSYDAGENWVILGKSTFSGYLLSVATVKSTWVTCTLSKVSDEVGATFISSNRGNSWEQIDFVPCVGLLSFEGNIFRSSIINGVDILKGHQFSSFLSLDRISDMLNVSQRSIYNIKMAARRYGSEARFLLALSSSFNFIGLLEGVSKNISYVDINWRKSYDPKQTTQTYPHIGPNDSIEGFSESYKQKEMLDLPGDILSIVTNPKEPGFYISRPSNLYTDVLNSHYVNQDMSSYLVLYFNYSELSFTYLTSKNENLSNSNIRHMAVDQEGDLIGASHAGIFKYKFTGGSNSNWNSISGNIYSRRIYDVIYLGNGTFASRSDFGIISGKDDHWNILYLDSDKYPLKLGPYNGVSNRLFYSVFPAMKLKAISVSYSESGIVSLISSTVDISSLAIDYKNDSLGLDDSLIYATRSKSLLVVLGLNSSGIYESFDNGINFSNLDFDLSVSDTKPVAVIYGNQSNGDEVQDVIYLASKTGLFVRRHSKWQYIWSSPPKNVLWPKIVDMVPNEKDYLKVAVLFKYGEILYTTDGGGNWSYLPPLKVGLWGLKSSEQLNIVIFDDVGGNAVFLVSGRSGLYVLNQKIGDWCKVRGLPPSTFTHLSYYEDEDMACMSFLGQGIWCLNEVSKTFSHDKFQLLPKPLKVSKLLKVVYALSFVVVFMTMSSICLAVVVFKKLIADDTKCEGGNQVTSDPK